MKIQLPEKVKEIIRTLTENGYEAYAVGGCVRDSILGREPEDWDITTSATPMETKALFPRTFDTGIAHGTVTVLMDKEGFEVTTYRIDGEYEDSRHPKDVTFTRSLPEDLLRRDFTINAMAYNDSCGLVDLFGGMEDLRQGVIRCVGNADERFSEDALRILRAVRFAAQLDFQMEEETRKAILNRAEDLRHISAERIQVELVKLLVSPHPEKLREAWELGITRVILPEFDRMMETGQETPHHCCSVGEHTLRALQSIESDRILRLTMLFHDMGKPEKKTVDADGVAHFKGHAAVSERMAREIMERLRFDNDTMRKVVWLVRWHDHRMPAQERAVRKAMQKIGEELFPYYLKIRRADTAAQSSYQKEEKEQNLRGVETLYQKTVQQKCCVSLRSLAIGGRDLIAAGIHPGPEIGQLLGDLLDEVVEEPDRNTREYLVEKAKELHRKNIENQA